MKKIVLWLVVIFFALTATGCVSTGSSKVKCPSCGYEFETPASGG